MSESEKDAFYFLNLVMMFQAAAMQHLGKIKNPITDTIQRDLSQAQYAIDTLDMLVNRTKGNLTPDEDRFLKSTLRDLKLNYVDELSKEPITDVIENIFSELKHHHDDFDFAKKLITEVIHHEKEIEEIIKNLKF
jgi:uncharacterized protein (UPF0305 family)